MQAVISNAYFIAVFVRISHNKFGKTSCFACANYVETGFTQHTVTVLVLQTRKGLSEKPPFGLADIKNAIPAHCLKKDAWRSMSYLFKDVAIVVGLAVAAYTIDQW